MRVLLPFSLGCLCASESTGGREVYSGYDVNFWDASVSVVETSRKPPIFRALAKTTR